jgi:hypothetical protein
MIEGEKKNTPKREERGREGRREEEVEWGDVFQHTLAILGLEKGIKKEDKKE